MKLTKLILPALFLLACFATVQAQQPDAQGFVPLFNGKNLDGWEGNPDIWRAEDGCIVGQTEADGPKKLTYNTFLILKDQKFDNFVIRFDIRLTKGGNSGVQYRSWVLEGGQPFRVAGYQGDFDGDNNYSGICYGEGFRGILANRGQESEIGDNHQPKMTNEFATSDSLKEKIKTEDWNQYEISANDYTFIHKINGYLTSVCIDKDKEMRRDSGIIAIQAHVGPPMKVEIKNIRIKKL